MAKNKKQKSRLEALTWDDLDSWAGSRIVGRGKSYQRRGYVDELATTADGALLAWVRGTRTYATKVEVQKGDLTSACSCPYGYACKHAVAVILEYLEKVKAKAEVPSVEDDDPRLAKLDQEYDEDWDEDDWDGDDGDDDEDEGPVEDRTTGKARAEGLSSFLNRKTKKELVELIEELASNFSAVGKILQERQVLASGNVGKIVQSLRSEIVEVTSEPAWQNSWSGEGNIPDYSKIQERLAHLLASGHADEVARLGGELLRRGIEQVGESHDEGDAAWQLSDCMAPVWRALPQSSLSTRDQILWVIDAMLLDDYGIFDEIGDFWERDFTEDDWGKVAEVLAERLKKQADLKSSDDFSSTYRRDAVSSWLIHALEGAGRPDEVIELCRAEAEKTGSYERLVRALLAAGMTEEAEESIRKGIADAEARGHPGTASSLRGIFRSMKEGEKDWRTVAAMDAEDFFREPGLGSFQKLEKSAKRARAWKSVKAHAMAYLEDGKRPPRGGEGKRKAAPKWPLPDCPLKLADPRGEADFPDYSTLIQIAIQEKKPDEVLRWYDLREEKGRGDRWPRFDDDKTDVADAVAGRFPDRAIAIWQGMAASEIARTSPSAYEVAAGHLRKVRDAMADMGQQEQWAAYLASIRQEHKRKRRLMETLDRLEKRPILKG